MCCGRPALMSFGRNFAGDKVSNWTNVTPNFNGYAGMDEWRYLLFGQEQIPPRPQTGYDKLMLALISDAFETLKAGPKNNTPSVAKCAYGQTVRWLELNDSGYVFSFVNICQHFGWDSDWM